MISTTGGGGGGIAFVVISIELSSGSWPSFIAITLIVYLVLGCNLIILASTYPFVYASLIAGLDSIFFIFVSKTILPLISLLPDTALIS